MIINSFINLINCFRTQLHYIEKKHYFPNFLQHMNTVLAPPTPTQHFTNEKLHHEKKIY